MQGDQEKTRQDKYNLLQTEIIDKGFDHMSFSVFCESIKKDGSDDIDDWTMEELEITIKQFQQRNPIEQNVGRRKTTIRQSESNNQPEESKSQDTSTSQDNIQASQRFTDKSQFRFSKNQSEGNFKMDVQCQQPKRSPLSDYMLENENKMIDILMVEHVTKSEGLFGTGYGAFRVDTNPLDWSVWRRFSDFVWLRQQLQKSYPLLLIPPIPKKKMYINNNNMVSKVKATNSIYLQKRMKVLELFLQNCIYHPLLRTHQALSDFLQISEDQKFKERLQFFEKQAGPHKPSEQTTLSGACSLEISDYNKNYAASLQDYLKYSSDIYKKLSSNFKQFFWDLDKLSSTLQKIQSEFVNLSKVTDQFCKATGEVSPELSQINGIYPELQQLMEGWHTGVIFQMKNVKENFYEFFRYHKKMQHQAYDYLNLRNTMGQKYQHLNQTLQEKKEKFFILGDTSKWDLSSDCTLSPIELQHNKSEAFKYMFQNDTISVDQNRDNFGFINKAMVEEINQMMSFRSDAYCKKFIRVAQMRALETAKLHHTLADFLQNIMGFQGQQSGNLRVRSNSIFIDPKYDGFFGIKPQIK